MGKNICKYLIVVWGWYPSYIKNSELSDKKQTSQLKMCLNYLKRHIIKENIQIENKYRKNVQHHNN